jgi:hypothetical protein
MGLVTHVGYGYGYSRVRVWVTVWVPVTCAQPATKQDVRQLGYYIHYIYEPCHTLIVGRGHIFTRLHYIIYTVNIY